MTSAFLRVYGGRGIPARRATLVMASRYEQPARKSHLIPHIAKQIGLKVSVIWRDIREALMPQNKLPAPVTWRSRLIGKSLSGSILMRCFRGSTEFDGPLGLRNRYINLCRQGFAELVGVLVC